MGMRFTDRGEAGRLLAAALPQFRGRPDTVLLGLARGGVQVAAEAAAALGLPWDVLPVRKLGIPGDAIQPSISHYREHSNMSSASIVHILDDVAAGTPVGSAINLLTMGAGFNVIYGRVRRVR